MSNSFDATGKIIMIADAQQVTEKFKKREFVIEIEDGNYPQSIKFQATNDRCDILDKVKVDDTVTVSFNLRGKPFVNKESQTVYFTNLEAWRIQKGEAKPQAPRDHTDSFGNDDVAF
jgi:hypothetical protein